MFLALRIVNKFQQHISASFAKRYRRWYRLTSLDATRFKQQVPNRKIRRKSCLIDHRNHVIRVNNSKISKHFFSLFI